MTLTQTFRPETFGPETFRPETFRPESFRPESFPRTLAERDRASTFVRHHFGAPVPHGLRDQADEQSWDGFVATYTHPSGPVRLGHWACTDPHRPAGRLGPQARNFRAMIAVGDHLDASTAAASGPIAALTAMLHDRGITIEIVKFHQLHSDAATVTFIRGAHGTGTEWAIGLADEPTHSALRAVIACANRLSA